VRAKEEAFYKKFFNREYQRVSIHNQDGKVLEYLSECVEATNGTVTVSTDLENLLTLTEQDLLIAEADILTKFQLWKISAQFPKVILIFYEENDRIEMIKQNFPKFERIIAPVRNRDIIDALRRLYA
jgi:hypothetical protein